MYHIHREESRFIEIKKMIRLEHVSKASYSPGNRKRAIERQKSFFSFPGGRILQFNHLVMAQFKKLLPDPLIIVTILFVFSVNNSSERRIIHYKIVSAAN
jgi:hypothetical protein